MNLDRIISMIFNQIMRRVMNAGINKGISHFAGKSKPAADMTAADHAQGANGNEMAKRARQAAKLTRRLGR
jgi:hypothetical protein